MTQNLYKRTFSSAFAVAALLGASAFAQDLVPAIKGKTTIDFATRKPENQDENGLPKKDIVDLYTYEKLNIGTFDETKTDVTKQAQTFQVNGTIKRMPSLASKLNKLGINFLGKTQEPSLEYDLKMSVLIGAEQKPSPAVGFVTGLMVVDKDGKFVLGDAKSNLSFSNKIAKAPLDAKNTFKGTIVGKQGEDKTYFTEIKTKVKGKDRVFKSQKSDPMKFQNLTLAAGLTPGAFPSSLVNGALIYDYATDTWNAQDLIISYTMNNAPVVDRLTGTIGWEEDPQYEQNHKSTYTFNLVYAKEGAPEAAASDLVAANNEAELSVEDLLAPDYQTASILGTVTFDDSVGHTEKDENGEDTWVPEVSKIEWDVKATKKVSPQQIMNVFKLVGLVGIGPFFDE